MPHLPPSSSTLSRAWLSARAFHAMGVGALAGVALQLQSTHLQSGSLYGSALALAVLGIAALRYVALRRTAPRALTPFAAWGILLTFGLLSLQAGYAYAGIRALGVRQHQLAADQEGKVLRLTGKVNSMTQTTDWGLRFNFRVQDPPPGVPDLLMVHWNGGAAPEPEPETQTEEHMTWALGARPPPLIPGEEWQLSLRLKAIHTQHNFGGFDGELWAWEQGLGASASVIARQADQIPERLTTSWSAPIERLRQSLRDRLLNDLQPDTRQAAVAPARWSGVLAALLVGDQAAIGREDWDLFRTTGVAHLVSISGLHITMFAWLARRLLRAIWRLFPNWNLRWPAPTVGAVGGWVCAALYALLSGWGLPAQRTIGMLACVMGLRLGGWRWPWVRVWLAVLCVVVVADPWALLSAGFWLSFVAVAVLFSSDTGPTAPEATAPTPATDALEDSHLTEVRAKKWTQRLGTPLLCLLKEQWVITLALAPLTLMLFQQQSLSGLVANLFAVPWVTLVVTPLCMIGVLIPYAWSIAGWAMHGLAWCLHGLAQWPLASVNVAAAPFGLSVLGLLGAMLLVLPLPWRLRLLASPAVLMVLLWEAQRPQAGQFEVNFSDIGQGNGVVVRTLSHTLVYDSGPRYNSESDAGHRVLLPVLRRTAETPQLLLISHQDNDHSGGADSLLSEFPDLTYLSSLPAEHRAARQKEPVRCFDAARGGQAWQWEGVNFEILHPDPDDYAKTAVRTNALSCVLRISNGQQTVLLVGDIEAPQEERLVQVQAHKLRADVLLVPHHGSKTSSTGVFLDAVAPRLAIVQSGYRNRYGHPAPRIMQRYEVRGIQVIDSPHCGAALWQSEQPARIQCSRATEARYWHHQIP